jgi:phenylalanyl-tRNA synthetase alpha chain
MALQSNAKNKKMTMIKERIQELMSQVEQMQAQSAEQMEALRIKYLSKKGEITELFNQFREVPKEEKKELGMQLNALRQLAESRLQEMREAFEAQLAAEDKPDLTRTPEPIALGTRHPLSLTKEEIVDIFSRLGFTVAEGPEVEDDKHVFGMLNFAPEHPARDMQDTFFVEKEEGVQKPTDILLRTHTSSVQTRVMTSQKPPIRVLCPGRVYRNEAISARAHCFFHQVEGLYIDKNVSFADLRQALMYFAKEMFGPDTKIRLRPSYFPFTEPSAEMDISCNICGGTGCGFCKQTGWVEILGCGMVDPNVLESCGIDSKEYSGYAFGMGVERITNLKYRVKDLRLFSENDVRFLQQFESC